MTDITINHKPQSSKSIAIFGSMLYISLVIASIILFNKMISVNIQTTNIVFSGSLIPYVCLYPLSFIMLKLQGYKIVNAIILSMIACSLVFLCLCQLVMLLPSSPSTPPLIEPFLQAPFKMYLGGLIAMPAGIYASFLALRIMHSFNIGFHWISLSIATIVGEIINTLIIFPIGFSGKYAMAHIFSKIVVDALIFKFITAIVLSMITMVILNIIVKHKQG